MRRTFLSLAVLLLSAAGAYAQPAAPDLTKEEWAFIDSCAENVTKKVYSPAKASECLDKLSANDHEMMDRLQQKAEIPGVRLLAYMNALKDLGDFFTDVDDWNMRTGLRTRLEAQPCVLCKMDLGPQPEKLYSWVSLYAGGQLRSVKKASYDWSTLSRDDRDYLTLVRKANEASWRQLLLSERQTAMDPKAEMTLSTGTAASMKKVSGKYNDVSNKLKAATAAGGAGAFLNKAFDNASTSGGEVDLGGAKYGKTPGKTAGPAVVYTLTDDQAAKLGPRLVQAYIGPGGELSGTKVGQEIVDFSKTPEGELKFSVATLDKNTNGVYNTGDGTVKVNKLLVEDAMSKYKVSADQLMDEENKAAIGKVARYTAPVFVHEYGGHQEQTAWAKKNGVTDFYYIDQETDAFSKQSLFVLQKQKAEREAGNVNYNTQIQEDDVLFARKLKKEGFNGIGREIMYYDVPSRTGKAAENFANYEDLKKELTARQTAATADPAAEKAADAAREDWQKTSALQQEYNSIFPWYKLSMKKTAEDIKYYQSELLELDKR